MRMTAVVWRVFCRPTFSSRLSLWNPSVLSTVETISRLLLLSISSQTPYPQQLEALLSSSDPFLELPAPWNPSLPASPVLSCHPRGLSRSRPHASCKRPCGTCRTYPQFIPTHLLQMATSLSMSLRLMFCTWRSASRHSRHHVEIHPVLAVIISIAAAPSSSWTRQQRFPSRILNWQIGIQETLRPEAVEHGRAPRDVHQKFKM